MLTLSHKFELCMWLHPFDRTLIVSDSFLATWYFQMLQEHLVHILPQTWNRHTWETVFQGHNLGARQLLLLSWFEIDWIFLLRTCSSSSFPHSSRWQPHSSSYSGPKPRGQLLASLYFIAPSTCYKSIDFIFKTQPYLDSLSPLALPPAQSIISLALLQ